MSFGTGSAKLEEDARRKAKAAKHRHRVIIIVLSSILWVKQLEKHRGVMLHKREHFMELLALMVERYCVVLHAYVLMDNHYHLLIETPEANATGGADCGAGEGG